MAPIEPHPLAAWRPEDVRRAAHRVADLIADYLQALPDGPVFSPFPAAEADRLTRESIPVDGTSADALFDEFTKTIAPFPFGNGHPRFWAWVNSPPAIIGVLADALASTMNPSVAGGNHAAVHIEHQVLRWFAEMLGFPDSAGGLLVSGGSMANLTGLAAARHARAGYDVRAEGLQGSQPRLTVYVSAEGHGCIRKSLELLGLGSKALRTIPTDERFEMQVPLLLEAIDRDLSAGDQPMAVVANAGSVNTGAIDPLEAIADVCRDRGIWLHVDGAYGAAAVLSSDYGPRLQALRRADSVALDSHKWLYVPVEAGLVLVRDCAVLRDAFSLVPPYLRTDGDPHGVGGPPWFSEFGFQQSRGFRALKVWMTLKYFGTSGYRSTIDHDIALARYLADRVFDDPELQVMGTPSLSIVCFRYVPKDAPPPVDLDAINRALLARLQLSGRAFISSTVLRGEFVLRACIVNPLSGSDDIDALIDAVKMFGAEAAATSA